MLPYLGHLEMVKFLLEAGADQEHKTDEMHTALMEASMDGHVEVARLLLDSGAQVMASAHLYIDYLCRPRPHSMSGCMCLMSYYFYMLHIPIY